MNDSGTINKVFLVGEITHNLRLHQNDSGNTVLCFTLTTRENFSQKGGQTEHTEEHSIRLPVNKQEYELKTGQWVHVEGKIKTTSFTDEKAIKRYKTEVVAVRVHPLRMGADSVKQTVADGVSNERE